MKRYHGYWLLCYDVVVSTLPTLFTFGVTILASVIRSVTRRGNSRPRDGP